MPKLNHLQIYKMLQKSNCRECGVPTCLAFAAAVLGGEKRVSECPHLDAETARELEEQLGTPQRPVDDDWEQALKELKARVESVDLPSRASRLGGEFIDGRLAIKCLGKDFFVDASGSLTSACHNNPWVVIPLLGYIINGAGLEPTGRWMPFKDLKGGEDWGRLFAQRCEKPLKQIVDNHTELFELVIEIFEGKPVENELAPDISVVIHPLPKFPVQICYWKEDGAIESTLSLFFDSSANDNLNIHAIYTLGVGLVTMFEKIALTHDKR